ncbi:helix-turn-helix domain-containing protein [Nocardiopsis sp. EMB25]|uniref:helix-turn-helix domain-containing protein n=1 Tax=Nocardiopsis sp. EMB25 TaxID=2835867 RepID=UPI002284262E|nr:helix-turn-helix transcriptional regulator [Nocardiopsis sp. EMB25]MCY9784146.1 helix-turn-helix domain-containing protein [Nocardiopsis sp. EMB25]
MPKKATVRARGLGAELKELRKQAKLPLTKVGERMGWSVATVSRIETGHRGVTSEEVAALLMIYEAPRDVRERLVSLAREADKPGWWETGDPGLPRLLSSLITFETQATTITNFTLRNVPGLLQTPDYIRAIMTAAEIPPQQAETRIVTRIGRQALLSRPNPPTFEAIIDEAALRRCVGGRSVMADQLGKLITEAKRPNITIRVVPFTQGSYVGLDGSFLMLEFPKARRIVHLEHKTSAMFLDEPADTDVYLRDLVKLRDSALSPSDSIEFIATIADEYKDL